MDLGNIKSEKLLDAKGLSSPMPLLKARKMINAMGSGQILEVHGTDPGSRDAIPLWCKRSGHIYLGDREDSGFYRFYIQKG